MERSLDTSGQARARLLVGRSFLSGAGSSIGTLITPRGLHTGESCESFPGSSRLTFPLAPERFRLVVHRSISSSANDSRSAVIALPVGSSSSRAEQGHSADPM